MDLQTLQQEHEELQGELRKSSDKTKKASCEVEVNLCSLRCYRSRDLTNIQGFKKKEKFHRCCNCFSWRGSGRSCVWSRSTPSTWRG